MKTKQPQNITAEIQTLFNKGLNIDRIQSELKKIGINKDRHYISNILVRIRKKTAYKPIIQTQTNPIQTNTDQPQTEKTAVIEQHQTTSNNINKHLVTIDRIKDINELIPKHDFVYYSRKIGGIKDLEYIRNCYDYNIKNFGDPNKKPINILIEGETQTAKTSFIKKFCYLNKIPYKSLNLNGQTTREDLIGGFINGGVFVYGFLSLIMKYGGVIVLEEFNTANSEILVCLNEVLINRTLTIPETSEIIHANKNFFICATQNPSHYEGRKVLSEDLNARFEKIYFNYDLSIEKKLIEDLNIIPFIEKLRYMRDNNEISKPLPITFFMEFERNKIIHGDKTALYLFLNRFDGIEKSSIQTAYDTMFNPSDIKKDSEVKNG